MADGAKPDAAPNPPPPPPVPFVPKMDTRSSNGLLDVPERRLAAAGVCERTSVAARPEGWPFVVDISSSSKSLRKRKER